MATWQWLCAGEKRVDGTRVKGKKKKKPERDRGGDSLEEVLTEKVTLEQKLEGGG
jgi:hypothetical protein